MKKYLLLAFTVLALMSISVSCTKPVPPVDKATISAAPATAQFTYEGGSVNIAVTTNRDDFTFDGQASWLTVVKDGKSLTLTAAENTELTPRECTITLTVEEASATIAVTQDKGSKYPGYTEMTAIEAKYYGTMYTKFYDMPDSDGGAASITLSTGESTPSLDIFFYTELYNTPEEVVLTEGEYTKGNDNPSNSSYVGKKMTFCPGGKYVIEDEEEPEEFYGGTLFTDPTTGTDIISFIADGNMTITKNSDGTYLIKATFKDKDGNDLKYFYEGALDYDISEATYPGEEKPDPTKVVMAECMYLGDYYESGNTTLTLMLFCADGSPITSIEYNIPAIEFEDLTDLSGEFYSLEGDNDYSAGSVNKGSLFEMEGFSFPMSTYIMFSFGDYFIADSFASLVLEKLENGHYSISSALMDTEMNIYMFDIEDMEIIITDDRDSGDED